MLRAGIDIGTNTILLLVAEVDQGRIVKVVEDHVTVVRLGQGVDKNRVFCVEAMERARACFANYANILKKYPGIQMQAVATSGSRDAKNSEDFFHEITASTGIPIQVISGPVEASTSFRGALPEAADPDQVAVLDIGGGSTEIVGQENGNLFRVSFDFGCVRLTERFCKSDPPMPAEQEQIRSFVMNELKRETVLLAKLKDRRFLGVAGTPTYLSSALLGLKKFDVERIHGSVIELAKLKKLRQELAKLTTAERLGLGGMDKGRADVIVTGAIILESVLESAGIEKIEVSVRGLRYGVVLTDWGPLV